MILNLTRYTTRLALRIKNLMDYRQVTDWHMLQLVISPGEDNKECCHVGGSPWVLTGCWPFHPTGIDVANPPHFDFPAIILDAFDADDEGRIVFRLDERVHSLPNGRYTGQIRVHPHTPPINLDPIAQLKVRAKNNIPMPYIGRGAAITYTDMGEQRECEESPYPLPPKPKVQCCVLASFDIDLGPECAQHIVDQCSVEFTRSSCGELCGEEQ